MVAGERRGRAVSSTKHGGETRSVETTSGARFSAGRWSSCGMSRAGMGLGPVEGHQWRISGENGGRERRASVGRGWACGGGGDWRLRR